VKDFPKPNVFISRCIEFEACRWNGAVISSLPVRRLKDHVNVITLCPEKEAGLGVPRKPVRLVKDGRDIRVVQSESGADVTAAMQSLVMRFLDELEEPDGFILKDRSPSCGPRDVKVYPSHGKVQALPEKGQGLFARAVMERYSHLALENEGRLLNFRLREHFLTGIFTRAAFRTAKREGRVKDLVDFHARNKLLFMACNQSVMRVMGRITANRDGLAAGDIFAAYEQQLHRLLNSVPRAGSHVNVLMHAMGYFSKIINAREKAWLLDLFELYRSGKRPLSACQAALGSLIVRHGVEYLEQQTYFHPYPEDLMDLADSGGGEAERR